MSNETEKHCMCGCIHLESDCPNCNKVTDATRIDELEAKLAWQPIETAPLDIPILLYGWWGWNDPADCQTTQIGIGRLNEWDEDDVMVYWESITCNPYKDEGKPTHWMPLPETPSQN
jgi:hypothetical protein